MHVLPAVDVGLGKCDFHYLRTKNLQLIIKDVHQEGIYLGSGETNQACRVVFRKGVVFISMIKPQFDFP